MAILHKYILVCDEIRQENTGKLILIGLYTPSINVATIPTGLRGLAFLVAFEADSAGKYPIQFTLTHVESGKDLFQGGGEVEMAQAGFSALPIQIATPVQFDEVGPYVFKIQIGDESAAHKFSVVLNQPKLEG